MRSIACLAPATESRVARHITACLSAAAAMYYSLVPHIERCDLQHFAKPTAAVASAAVALAHRSLDSRANFMVVAERVLNSVGAGMNGGLMEATPDAHVGRALRHFLRGRAVSEMSTQSTLSR